MTLQRRSWCSPALHRNLSSEYPGSRELDFEGALKRRTHTARSIFGVHHVNSFTCLSCKNLRCGASADHAWPCSIQHGVKGCSLRTLRESSRVTSLAIYLAVDTTRSLRDTSGTARLRLCLAGAATCKHLRRLCFLQRIIPLPCAGATDSCIGLFSL